MNFFVIHGYLGSGKTLGASILAKYYEEQSNCTLYSNFGLKGSKPFTKMEDFIEIAKEPSSILVLDEAHMDLDARSFSTNHVKFFTQVSYYLRKLRCTMFLTTPNFADLDSRIRGITNIYCPVSKDKNYFYYPLYDWQSNRLTRTVKIKKQDAFKLAEGIFDSGSMVTPISIPDKKGDYLEFLEELKQTSEVYYKQLKEVGA